jgi:hypothetical protein
MRVLEYPVIRGLAAGPFIIQVKEWYPSVVSSLD